MCCQYICTIANGWVSIVGEQKRDCLVSAHVRGSEQGSFIAIHNELFKERGRGVLAWV